MQSDFNMLCVSLLTYKAMLKSDYTANAVTSTDTLCPEMRMAHRHIYIGVNIQGDTATIE